MKRFALLLLFAAGCSQDGAELDYPIAPSGGGAIGNSSDNGGGTGTSGGDPNTVNLSDGGVGVGDGGFGGLDSGTGFLDGGVLGGGDADTTGTNNGVDAGPDNTQDMTPPLPDQIP